MISNDNLGGICDVRLTVLALDGVFDTGLTVFLDTFSTANELASAQGADPLFDVRVVGVRPQVRTAMGLVATVEAVSAVGNPDWVIVPALNTKQPERLKEALRRDDVVEAMTQLSTWKADGVGIAGACIGTFLLAEAGILDGLDATTTWSLAPLFRQRYPKVRLDDSQMIAATGKIVTAGAAMGHLDLALWLMRQASPEMAALVARFMIIDRRPSQSQYIIPNHLAHADPLIERFERWAREHLALGFSLQDASSAFGVTPRTLQRRSEAILGKSPLAFFQDLRIERAQHLVSIGQDLDKIATEVGYAESATLRSLLRRKLGRGVRELRAELH
jgi:transcriptional regulator GlxA family with amidase domain